MRLLPTQVSTLLDKCIITFHGAIALPIHIMLIYTKNHVDAGILLYKKLNKMVPKDSNNNVSSSDCYFSESLLQKMKKFNPDDVEGDAIESDDEMEDEDLDESEMSKNYHVNDGAIDSELYSQIRSWKRSTKEIKIIYSPPGDPDPPNEKVNGLSWCMDTNIGEPDGLGIHPPSHINKEFQNTIFRTELESFLAFLPL